jgi:hypothetical protein
MKKKYILPHVEVINIKPSHALLIGSKPYEEETSEVWARSVEFDPEIDDEMDAGDELELDYHADGTDF